MGAVEKEEDVQAMIDARVAYLEAKGTRSVDIFLDTRRMDLVGLHAGISILNSTSTTTFTKEEVADLMGIAIKTKEGK
jgi:hypothetical protein